MKSAVKTAQPSVVDFSDLSGGWNCAASPENIAQSELASVINMTYDSQSGRLRTRPGVGTALFTASSDIDGLVWYAGALYAAAAGTLCRVTGTAGTVGALTGTGRPVFCEFGADLFIASGGKLNKFDGSSLTTVTDSPEHMAFVYARTGRLWGFESGSDVLRGSSLGDGSTWTIPASATAADPVELQIGYKVAGSLTCAIPSLTDVVLFKTHGAFRLSGDYPDFVVSEVSRDEAVSGPGKAANVGGYLFYLESSKGARVLQGTSGYEQVIPSDTLPKVNPWIRENMGADARLVHLPARSMIVLLMGDETAVPVYYKNGFADMPALLWEFHGEVGDLCEPDRDSLYIAVNKSVYDFSGSNMTDPTGTDGAGEYVPCEFECRRFVSLSQYMFKRLSVDMSAADFNPSDISDSVSIRCSGSHVVSFRLVRGSALYVYGNDSQVFGFTGDLYGSMETLGSFQKHNLFRTRDIQLRVSTEGPPLELNRLRFEAYSLGVNS